MYIWTDIPDHIYSLNDIVYIRVLSHFRSISHINTVGQEFDSKMWIQLKWKVNLPKNQVNLDREWQPLLEVVNNHGKLIQERCVMVKKRKREDITAIYANYMFEGTFSEQFNLKQFPIDVQELHLSFVLWGCPIVSPNMIYSQNAKKLKFYTRPMKNHINEVEFIPCEIWTLNSPVFVTQGESYAPGNVTYCMLDVSFLIGRKAGFYLINILLPTFIIVVSSIAARMLRTFETQQNLVYTLMLTIVSLKFATVNFIPKTSVITYLDRYSIMSFIWVTTSALHNIIIHLLEESNKYDSTVIHNVDVSLVAWLLSGWIFFNIVILMVSCGRLRKSISHHYYHINKHKRSLIMIKRHDKLGDSPSLDIAIDIDDIPIKCNDDENSSSKNMIRKESTIKDMLTLPSITTTAVMSCINGTIMDNSRSSAFHSSVHAILKDSRISQPFDCFRQMSSTRDNF